MITEDRVQDHSKMRILVVDDDEDVVFALVNSIRRLGHDVEGLMDAQAAYDVFRKRMFDVVLCDLAMPGLDGRDLCRAIRELSRESYTYIIVLTGRAVPEACVQSLDAGADQVITKGPFVREHLGAALRVAQRTIQLHVPAGRLEGTVTLCACCKAARDDEGCWVPVERYLARRTELKFSHGICRGCRAARYPPAEGRQP